MRQLLRQNMRTRAKPSNDAVDKNTTHSNDDLIEGDMNNTNDELETLHESKNKNGRNNSRIDSQNNNGDEISLDSASPRRSGQNTPKKDLSRSKQHIREEDSVMLEMSINKVPKLLSEALEDEVVLLGLPNSPSNQRSARVALKKSK